MRTHRPTETTDATTTRRCVVVCVALAVALALGIAGAGAALAVPAHAGPEPQAAQRDAPPAGGPVPRDGSSAGDGAAAGTARSAPGGASPVVPLLFAGIVILAAAGPWVPPGSRYRFYRVERRW